MKEMWEPSTGHILLHRLAHLENSSRTIEVVIGHSLVVPGVVEELSIDPESFPASIPPRQSAV